jgi:hypothetical protein
MVPSTVGGILVLLMFVVPGIWHELVRQRVRPGRSDSAFIETSRILLAGALISTIAVAALMLAAWVEPKLLLDLRSALLDGKYVANHLALVLWTLAWFLTLAMTFGPFWLCCGPARAVEVTAFPESLWITYFARLPMQEMSFQLKFVELFVRTSNGQRYQGRLGAYSGEPDVPGRELALVSPLYYASSETAEWTELQDAKWNAVILKGDDIAEIRVRNVGPAVEQPPARPIAKKGRPTSDRASGRLLEILVGDYLFKLIRGLVNWAQFAFRAGYPRRLSLLLVIEILVLFGTASIMRFA